MKIVVVSDNHGKRQVLQDVLNQNKDADYFIHCGDSEMPKDMLRGYVSVRGNNDYDYNYPEEYILDTGVNRILILHGNRYIYMNNRDLLIYKAKQEKCNIVCFGHTHIFESLQIDGVWLVNPGSLWQNRDGDKPCYAIINIEDKSIKVFKKIV